MRSFVAYQTTRLARTAEWMKESPVENNNNNNKMKKKNIFVYVYITSRHAIFSEPRMYTTNDRLDDFLTPSLHPPTLFCSLSLLCRSLSTTHSPPSITSFLSLSLSLARPASNLLESLWLYSILLAIRSSLKK